MQTSPTSVRSRVPQWGLRSFAALAIVSMFANRADAQVTFSASGSAAGIQSTVDAYRTALGPLNANVAGSFGSGRREINWDGVPEASATPNPLPGNFFNVNSPRGVVFSTPGTGLAVSANAGGATPILFGDIDPTYGTTFSTFSAQRIFTAIGSNVIDVNFFVAGTTTAALTRGFGAVFTDVDLANTTSLQFFSASNELLGTYYAPTGSTASGSLSFLGISFSQYLVSRVRITTGNTALGAGVTDQNGNSRDVVAMDDFIFAETIAAESVSTVPEPGTYALLAGGLLAVGMVAHRRRIV